MQEDGMQYMFDRGTTVCFTGHRQLREPAEIITPKLVGTLESLVRSGCLTFCAGGARGFDALASETVIALQAQYPQIRLVLMLPFPDQYGSESGWSAAEIEQYRRIQAQASQVVTIAPGYCSGVYYRRNRALVDASSVCIAYMTRSSSGTGYTVRYARKQGLEIINRAESDIRKESQK
jgi:uncharacterized phage-like protein YoqJ